LDTCDFFKDFGSNDVNGTNDESEYFNEHNNFVIPNTVYPELDNPFTVDEIVSSVKLLERNNVYGGDNLLNEYFIETVDILNPHICKMWNKVVDSGFSSDI